MAGGMMGGRGGVGGGRGFGGGHGGGAHPMGGGGGFGGGGHGEPEGFGGGGGMGGHGFGGGHGHGHPGHGHGHPGHGHGFPWWGGGWGWPGYGYGGYYDFAPVYDEVAVAPVVAAGFQLWVTDGQTWSPSWTIDAADEFSAQEQAQAVADNLTQHIGLSPVGYAGPLQIFSPRRMF